LSICIAFQATARPGSNSRTPRTESPLTTLRPR
jgi:hypothetical protein